jgi:hypothetical protein
MRRDRAAIAFAALALGVSAANAGTVTFREGASSYSGTRDTFLEQAAPGIDHGQGTNLRWDADYPSGTGLAAYVLLRFEGIVGSMPGQIPPGATINSAVLTYVVTDTGDMGELREPLADWTEASTFASYCGEACTSAVIGPLIATMPGAQTGETTAIVTSAVQRGRTARRIAASSSLPSMRTACRSLRASTPSHRAGRS